MNIYVLHASAGHGHTKAAQVIAKSLETSGSKNKIHFEDVLKSTPKIFSIVYPAIYFYSVKHTPNTWGWFYEKSDHPKVYRLIYPFRRLGNAWATARLVKRVLSDQPDVIVNTHFLGAEVFGHEKVQGRLHAKLITVITDYYPHEFWIHEGTDLYWVMSDEGADDLVRRGVPREKIRVGGIPTDMVPSQTNQASDIRKKWGFSDERFTLLLTSGSFGFSPHGAILKLLDQFHDRVQCFVVCGRNEALKNALESETYRFPTKIFGFVDFMEDLMAASDLMVAKPGGITTTESLVKGVPMVVYDPIPGQESGNARVLKERNAAFFIKYPAQLELILKNIFDHPRMLKDKIENIKLLAKPNALHDITQTILKVKEGNA